jgi:hypothetical protein
MNDSAQVAGGGLEQPGDKWTVWRLDDNGNQFVVENDLTFQEAKALALELENRGHKQVYWCVAAAAKR